MVMNSIKISGDGLALQVTLPARDAALVEENSDGEWSDPDCVAVRRVIESTLYC
jgi:hypothetical protein